MTYPDFSLEKRLWGRGFQLVIGVDEVGRGSFAGPVVAGAASLRIQNSLVSNQKLIEEIEKIGINDSKKLSAKKREKVAEEIKKYFFWAVGESSSHQINTFGIVKATNIAVRKAVIKLLYQASVEQAGVKDQKLITKEAIENLKPYLLLDAFHVRYIPVVGLKYQQVIIGGDVKVTSIAAASVVAKVYRDDLMVNLAKLYPQWGFEKNSGYGTAGHREALARYGISAIHRTQFVKKWVVNKE
ncbi:hypothetical protein A2Y99_01865 [Candidatus Gottesmanbacteria bacterium RBG_13_37_7]|uniref:Ribonuclease n=1 Tax=Candidatus Gottesmanbacteria bacterium RBG_13_37_7 TaxID=1798369 RepID=A0A1F5YKA1_9BACT|nr:MAG: hypothetical protein A2Y99_01865 [Candidatus Gottesmanbacteria bacterium RBG_13_37_7]